MNKPIPADHLDDKCPTCESLSKGVWSTEVPTEPGLYWMRRVINRMDYATTKPVVIEIKEAFGGLCSINGTGSFKLRERSDIEWYSIPVTPLQEHEGKK